jgi:hypothetical protein
LGRNFNAKGLQPLKSLPGGFASLMVSLSLRRADSPSQYFDDVQVFCAKSANILQFHNVRLFHLLTLPHGQSTRTKDLACGDGPDNVRKLIKP